MVSVPSEIDRLISLDDSSDYDTSQEDHAYGNAWQYSNPQLESDVSRLKAENTDRLHKRWDEIIAKYSKVDDNKESDEIDLSTGKITIDNGHLRSFVDGLHSSSAHISSSVWAVDDQFEKQLRKHRHAEKLRRRLRHEEQQRLKASGLFFNKNMQLMDFGTEPLPDNILLLNSSPTKKQKTTSDSPTSLSQSSPIKNAPKVLSYGLRLNTPKTSPLKQRLPSLASSPSQTLLESPTRLKCPALYELNETKPSNVLFTKLTSSPDSPHSFKHITMSQLNEDKKDTDENYEYEELFLITELSEPAQYAYFTCAFHGCHYTFTSKASYRSHLLSSHSPELQQIGYPVHSKQKYEYHIPGDTILKLNLHFPIKVSTLPVSPFRCGSTLGLSRCQKLFTDKTNLRIHQLQAPRLCSPRKQVFLCPLLGCEYMTDTSYTEYFNHMNTHINNFLTRSRCQGSSKAGVEEPAEYFTESVSSIIFSDQEKEGQEDGLHSNKSENVIADTSFMPRQRRTWMSTANCYDEVPKLDILDGAIDFDLDCGQSTQEQGYSSIEELFQDES